MLPRTGDYPAGNFLSAEIARVAYEANRAYCKLFKDDSFHSWEDTTRWQRDAAIKKVIFYRENPLAILQETEYRGKAPATEWRIQGEVLVTTPQAAQLKELLFKAIVQTMTALDTEESIPE